MTRTTRRPTRRNRLAWLIGTKAALALALALPGSLRREAAEYRALAPLPGLQPGAPVTLAGQLIGEVVGLERHGDTTALRVRFVRGAERLPGSRIIRLRRVTRTVRVGQTRLASEVTALEIRMAMRHARPESSRSFARGGWLEVLPSDGPDELFADPPSPSRMTPLPPRYAMPVLPWAPPARSPAPIART